MKPEQDLLHLERLVSIFTKLISVYYIAKNKIV